MNNESIVKALETMVAALQAQSDAHTTALAGRKFSFELGRKYMKACGVYGVARAR